MSRWERYWALVAGVNAIIATSPYGYKGNVIAALIGLLGVLLSGRGSTSEGSRR